MHVNVLRLTRHEATPEQIAALRAYFGPDVRVTEVNENFPNTPKEAVARFDALAARYDAVEVVLPVGLLEAVLKFSFFTTNAGGQVFRAVMEREITDNGAVFAFSHYERVISVSVVTERM